MKRPSQNPGDPHSATMFETRGLTKLKGERQFLSPLLGLLSPFPAGPNVHFAQLQVISQMPRPLDRNRKSSFVFSLIYILIIILLNPCFRLVSHSAHHSLRSLCYSPHLPISFFTLCCDPPCRGRKLALSLLTTFPTAKPTVQIKQDQMLVAKEKFHISLTR